MTLLHVQCFTIFSITTAKAVIHLVIWWSYIMLRYSDQCAAPLC